MPTAIPKRTKPKQSVSKKLNRLALPKNSKITGRKPVPKDSALMMDSKSATSSRIKKKSRRVGKVIKKPRKKKDFLSSAVFQLRALYSRIQSINPLWFLVIALMSGFLVMSSGFYWLYRQTILSFKVSPSVVTQAHLRASEPIEIRIESADLRTAVIEATIKDGIWQTSLTSATHLDASARPLEGGNVVIYGHNKGHLFANLHSVSKGDLITLKTRNNKSFGYEVTDIKVLNPDQIEAVLPTDYEVLTIYTCTGFLDSKRLVIRAVPKQVENS